MGELAAQIQEICSLFTNVDSTASTFIRLWHNQMQPLHIWPGIIRICRDR